MVRTEGSSKDPVNYELCTSSHAWVLAVELPGHLLCSKL